MTTRLQLAVASTSVRRRLMLRPKVHPQLEWRKMPMWRSCSPRA